MGLFNSLVKTYLRQRLSFIRNFAEKPVPAQQKQLEKLIRRAKNTEFGSTHGFSSIKTASDFQQQVPLHDYDSIKPFIERAMKGELDVLWPGRTRWFAKSSGTTSDKSKFIPVSRETLHQCHFACGTDVLALYVKNNPDTQLFNGRGLIMGGSNQVNSLSSNSWYGDISAVMMKNMPPVAGYIRTPSLDIALLSNWDEKIEKIAQQTMRQNVTHMVGVPTWIIVLIQHIFREKGVDNLADVWPNLELILHGGVSFTPYREQFQQLIRKPDMHYMETYNASEGFFALQDDLDDDGLLLMLNYGIFYEFIPVEQAEKEHPLVLTLEQVETGKNYAMVISTNSGLWRYKIGDTVMFTSTNPYKIKITGRIVHYINAFGEEVIVNNSDTAVAEACAKTASSVKEYTVAPVFISGEQKGKHEWLIEFNKEPEDLDVFVVELDKALQQVNSDYEAKRFKSMALELPDVRAVKDGTFHEWLRRKGKLGGQNKIPRLSNERKYVDELLELQRELQVH